MKLSPGYVGIILCRENGDLFLVKRKNSAWAESQWNFPGGLVEEDESIMQAAIRETQEEIGVTVKANDFSLTHVLDVHKGGTNDKSIYGFYFMTSVWSGNACNNEPEKIADAQWFDVNALPDNITEHALLAIEALQQSKTYMQSGW
jgi:8-oxo-dGTP diphosphatase